LARFLQDVGEPRMAEFWRNIEDARRGGFYGHHTADTDVDQARRLWQEVRTWALS
jgi:hypothetical protein